MMEGLRTNTSRPSSWIRSLARLCRPLPVLLFRLLLSLPGRWLQLIALAWGALLGRDRLLMQAEEEAAEWQEMLKAFSGGPLHSQGLYLGKESLLWESGRLGGGKGMPSDTLGGLPPGLLEGLPSSLLEGLPAEVINRHFEILSSDEGQLNIQNFPGFSMVSCVLGQQWTEYEDCVKESGAFTGLYNSQSQCDVYGDPGDNGYLQWQYPATDLHANNSKTAVQNGTGFTEHFRKRTENSSFNNNKTEPPEYASNETEPLLSFTKPTDTPYSAIKTDLIHFSTKGTLISDSIPQNAATVSKGVDANLKRSESPGDGASSTPNVRIPSFVSYPPVYPEQPLQLCETQASAEGPGSLSAQCECTQQDCPELQLIRTKRLDFLGEVNKAYLLPTPDQDHGYCSLEENLLHHLDQDTPCSHEGSFLQQSESSQDTGYLVNKIPDPLSCCKETHTCQQKDHNTLVSGDSMSWRYEDPLTASCEILCRQAPDDGSSPHLPPDIPSCLLAHDKGDISTGTSPLFTDLLRSSQEKLNAYPPSKELLMLHTRSTDENDVCGVDSDIEEDLPVPVRPVCNNKLIGYILGAVCSDDEVGSSDSESDWDEEECDDGFDSEGSLSVPEDSEDQQLWKSFSSQDPYHPNNFTAAIETALKIKEEPAVGDHDLLANSNSEDEPSWGESSPESASTSSDENDDEDDDYSEDSADEAENMKLWNSFNNSDDPYNPLCFTAPVQTVLIAKSGIGSHSKLGTVGSHCCISLPLQEHPSEIFGIGLCAVQSSNVSGGSRQILKQKKVTFLDQVTEYCVSNEDRKGQWEEYARDRCRFQKRIQETEQAIGHCFTPIHRQRLWDSVQQTLKSKNGDLFDVCLPTNAGCSLKRM